MTNQICKLNEEALLALKLEGSKSHFSHTDELSLCRFLGKYTVSCNYCNKIIRDPIPAYCCVDCEFFIHICCADIKEDILKADLEHHPFYRQHVLGITRMSKGESKDCKACTKQIRGVSLSSSWYHFDLHVSCIKPSPRALNHKSHRHSLFYFRDKSLGSLKCSICCKECEGSFYRCVICDKNFHVECTPLPRVVKKDKSHNHPLMLLGSLKLVYNGEEYSCDICDKPGKAGHHVYYCDECKFMAHVECVLNEDDTSLEIEEKQGHEDMLTLCSQKRILKQECHEHNLFYFLEKGDNFSHLSCKICSRKCKGGFYWCPECRISFHVDCIRLPRIIVLMEHTSYRLTLILLDLVIDDDSDHDHHCEFCKKTTISEDHVYYCQELNFFAHIECLLAEGRIMHSLKKLLPLDPELEQVEELQEADTEKENKIDADCIIEPNITKDDTSPDKTQQPNAAEGESSIQQPKIFEQIGNPATQLVGVANFLKNSFAEDANSNAPTGQKASSSLNSPTDSSVPANSNAHAAAEDDSSIVQEADEKEIQKRQAADGLNEHVEPSIKKEAVKGSSWGFGSLSAPKRGFFEEYVKPAQKKIGDRVRNLDNDFLKNIYAEDDANSNAPTSQKASSSLNSPTDSSAPTDSKAPAST